MSKSTLILAAALGVGCVAAALTVAAAPDNKAVAGAVGLLADKVGKKDWAALCKDGEAIARKYDTDELMYLLRPRNAKKHPGLGVGSRRGVIRPDGIEQKIQSLARRVTADDVKNSRDLERMAEVTAAIASVIVHQWPRNAPPEKGEQQWRRWTEEMYRASLALRDAARTKKADRITRAARRLNESCVPCHFVE